jgi:hypothetical protein
MSDNESLAYLHPLFARIVPTAELSSVSEVRALFPEGLLDTIYELTAGNHRGWVHSAWWYSFYYIFILLAGLVF